MNYVHCANVVWTELHERFFSVSGHKIYEVERDLFKIEQGASSVELYFHKLKRIMGRIGFIGLHFILYLLGFKGT